MLADSIVRPITLNARHLANRVLRGVVPCRRARTAREFDAIARLRYEVHIRELNVGVDGVDHERRCVWEAADEDSGARHFYAGTPEHILGALRVRTWRKGEIPAALWRFYSLDALPGAERLTISEVGRLVVASRYRGTAAMGALSGFAIEETVREWRNDLMVAVCVPGLLRAYRSIGLRTFGGTLQQPHWGAAIPLVGLTSDLEHTRRIGSPWYPALRRLEYDGALPPDLPAYRAQCERDTSVVSDADVIAREISDAADAREGFLSLVTPQTRGLIARYGVIFDVPAGLYTCRQGVAEREMFVILRGAFEALRGDTVLNVMSEGEVFGEVALLSSRGRRSADVRARAPSRVLALRSRFLRELGDRDPRRGIELYRALTQSLLDRHVLRAQEE